MTEKKKIIIGAAAGYGSNRIKQASNGKLYFPPVTVFALIEALVSAQTVSRKSCRN